MNIDLDIVKLLMPQFRIEIFLTTFSTYIKFMLEYKGSYGNIFGTSVVNKISSIVI
jgi:hypothetical protein